MSAQYIMKKMPDIHGTGEEITYPQMVMTGQTGTRELAEYISAKCAFAKGVTEGVILELGEALAHEMAMGRSVKIEGIGVFSPALALREDKEREKTDENAVHRNAQSIVVGNINSGPIKHCRRIRPEMPLERAHWRPRRSSKNTFRNNVWTQPEIPGRESVPHRTHLLPADRITEKFRYHGIA